MSRTQAVAAAYTMVESFLVEDADQFVDGLHALSEASRDSSLSLSALLSRYTSSRGVSEWARVYNEQERHIRGALHGSIGEIERSCTRNRFRVLDSPYAPADPASHLPRVEISMKELHAEYVQIARKAAGALARPVPNLPVEEAGLVEVVRRFAESLASEASASASLCGSVLAEFGPGAMPEIVRIHDALAGALVDYKVALAYTERALPRETP